MGGAMSSLAAAGPAGQIGRIGPNAITRVAEVLPARVGSSAPRSSNDTRFSVFLRWHC